MRVHIIFAFAIGVLLTLGSNPVLAGEPAQPVFASYSDEFVRYWRAKARQQNALVWSVVAVGVVGVLIVRSGGHKRPSY